MVFKDLVELTLRDNPTDRSLNNRNRRMALAGLFGFVLIIAFGWQLLFNNTSAPGDTKTNSSSATRQALALPTLPPIESNPAPSNQPTVITVHKGDTLLNLGKRLGLSWHDLAPLLKNHRAMQQLRVLRPGHQLTLTFDNQHHLHRIDYVINALKTLRATLTNRQVSVQLLTKSITHLLSFHQGTIHHSLISAMAKAGLSSQQCWQFVKLFSGQIDFNRQLKAGDQFNVLVNEKIVGDKRLSPGPITLAQLTTGHHTLTAIRFQYPNGKVAYYTPKGRSLKRAFMRFPLKFKYISSPFEPRRWHPLLHRFRAHEGVDLAAPSGTKVHAAADGVITLRGRDGGYGNAMIIQHGRHYSTLYAHLSRFARSLHPGSHVHKGQLIAYVGSTGLSTGPHLHYEVRIDGVHYNPVTVKLPNAAPLAWRYRRHFKQKSKHLLEQLALRESSVYRG